MRFDEFLKAVAAKSPTPGGGAVASAVGGLAAALGQMVLAYSLGKKSLAEHEAANGRAMHALENARRLLLALADEDAAAYGLVNELSRLPEDDARRIAEYPAAMKASVQVPAAVAAACVDVLRLFETLTGTTNKHLRSDLAIAAVLAEGAARSSRWNVIVNVGQLPEAGERETVQRQVDALIEQARELCARIEAACLK